MPRNLSVLLHGGALLALLCLEAAHAADTGTDPSLVVDKYIQTTIVNADGSYRMTVDSLKTLVLQRAVQTHGQYYISYNRTLDEVVAIEAATIKPDGRRIAVPPEQIKDQQESASSDAPMFQDTRVKIVVFPELAAGDQVAVRYEVRRAQPLFPGQFEDLSASQFFRVRQFQLIYDMPDTLPLYADAVGYAPLAVDSAPGRKRYAWQYVDGDNARIEADSVSYLDYGKRLAVSTFADYPAFARAYEARARAMAEPSAAIAVLAHTLTAQLSEPRAKAIALSEWVRKNVRYVGVYIGPGGVVPHEAGQVLENRYGDCKDHAVLLEALLNAAGIASTSALINANNAYRLPRIPTLGIFNHVITYVPSLALYLDSTAASTSAGYLPDADLDKPVLLTASGELARTPHAQTERSRNVAMFKVGKDGSSSFTVAKLTAGAIAEPYRQAVRDTKPADRALFVQRMLQGIGQKGSGVFDAGKLDGNADDYKMEFAGTSDNFASLPGPTGVATAFSFWGGLADTLTSLTQEKERSQDFICPGIDQEDVTGLDFPRGASILALPRAVTLHDRDLSYSASYVRRNNSVLVSRRLRFAHAGLVCSPAEFRRIAPLIDQITRDLKSQVIVKGR